MMEQDELIFLKNKKCCCGAKRALIKKNKDVEVCSYLMLNDIRFQMEIESYNFLIESSTLIDEKGKKHDAACLTW